MTPAQEEESSQNEENVLDFSEATPDQKQEKQIREIFFSEENGHEFLKPEETVSSNLHEMEPNEMFVCPVSEAEVNMETINASAASDTSMGLNEEMDDFFCGWTQTTKNYSHFGLEGKEIDLTAETQEENKIEEVSAEINEIEEANETEEVFTSENDDSLERREIDAADSEPTPILSEDGTLCRVLNRYEHPSMGFGFGLLDEEDSLDVEAETSQMEEATASAETKEEESTPDQEAEIEVSRPEGLDTWGSLAFELGLPVTLPETAEKEKVKSAADMEKIQKQEKNGNFAAEKSGRVSSVANFTLENVENTPQIDLDDDDFVSPENVFAETQEKPEKTAKAEKVGKEGKPERSRRSRRSKRGTKEEADVSVFEEHSAETLPSISETESQSEESVPRRRSRRRNLQETVASEEKSVAIGGIMASVVASKMTETEKTQSKTARRRDTEEMPAVSTRGERSRRQRVIEEELLSEQNEFCVLEEDSSFSSDDFGVEEMEQPNGARSRRRRRNQREKLERTRVTQELPAALIDEEDDEEEREESPLSSRKRTRRDGRRASERFTRQDDDSWQEPMNMELEIEEEEEEEEDLPRPRRQRRSRRSASQKSVSHFEEQDFDDEEAYPQNDEEAHIFTEVGDDEEDDDGEWETDFSQHDVPGWRYTIDFIVNTNLKARKREPSSMAGSINRMVKRGGKRK